MYFSPSIAAAGFLAVVMATASPLSFAAETRQTTCAPIHLFVARGTTESPGDGSIGSLAQLVINAHSGATQEAINYPASSYPTYIDDVSTGITAVTNQFTKYTSSCPNSTLVLIGYSQGAQIILDALCGSGSATKGGTGSPTITASQGKNIAAVVGYGDPGHVAGESWNEGTATTNGIYARPKGACNAWANVIHSYCNTGDPFCASGNNIMVHLQYPQTYNTQASQWIGQQLSSHAA
ncbi:cutinase [Talaromyces proteolyticus]|uniref:Cutinase n=1 Tax=Talaromyces proteolyticus TaxID=1131652 RepID=A0AAD4KNX4_9EURO|nr:cutinase [Talaromyces proteolyticus]KAH8696174.1 cutinase [Talaromyces proteolyticus]